MITPGIFIAVFSCEVLPKAALRQKKRLKLVFFA